MEILGQDFYQRSDVLQISRELLGKYLCSRDRSGRLTAGRIVETEAYGGETDRASHAYGARRTSRTEIMYAEGGRAYVYLIYGLHALFNVVTNRKGIPDAVLIRALQPANGIEIMLKRRRMERPERRLTAGPGVLTQAMGISTDDSGTSLLDGRIWLEARGENIAPKQIITSPRVGVGYAGSDALRPWRFRLRNNAWTSPAN